MSFLHPGWLWLLLLSVPLMVVHVRGRAGAATWRTGLLAGLRVLGLLLLVTALARPVVHRDDATTTTVLVADCSASVSDAELAGVRQQLEEAIEKRAANESVRLVTFDEAAREIVLAGRPEVFLRDSAAIASSARSAGVGGSAIADALDLAGLLIRNSGRGKVVLFSDGRETAGDARAAAWRLAKRGIPLQCNSVGASLQGEALIKSVQLPATGGIGATVEMKVAIEVSQAAQVVLEVRDDAGGEVLRSEHRLEAGGQEVSVPLALQREGLCRYVIRLSADRDALTGNNELSAAIQVAPAIRVGVIEDNPAEAAAPALRALAGAAAEVSRLDPADANFVQMLSDKEVLLIADAAAETIPATAQAAIRDAVTRGMGLLMTGGRRAFGPARFADSALAEVMPLRFPQGLERRDPSATVVIIIDTSGSMTGPRVSLAKEIARLALSRLKPHDKAGIVEFYGSKRWAAPIQSAANAIDLQRALNRLSAGGGTVILPAMEEAYYALQNVNTRTKHVLVLTDGGVETGAFEPLIRKMADHNITLSTVMVGPGAHSTFLASLAHWGRGRFYAAPDRFNLPEIIVKQPENSLSLPFVEQTSSLVASRRHALLDDIDLATCPALTGYVESTARPTAETVLASDLGHPVLARWQYGLGSVAAWTSQLGGEWSGDVMQWPSAGRLFSNLLRNLAGIRPEQALAIRPTCRAGTVELDIRNLLAASEAASAAIEVMLSLHDRPAGGDGFQKKWTLDPYAPHRWNLRIADLQPGTYAVQARTLDEKRQGAAGLVVNEPRELASLDPDVRLLADLTRIAGKPAGVAASVLPKRAVEIWPLFAALFVPLMLLHVLIRRWPLRLPVAPVVAVVGILSAFSYPPVPANAAATATVATPATAATAPSGSWQQAALARGLSDEVVAHLARALAGSDAAAEESYTSAARSCLTQLGTLGPLMETLQAATESSRGPWLLARAARDAGQLTFARDTLAGIVEREPGRFEAWAELARVEEWLGNDKGALGRIEKAMQCPCEPAQKQALLLRAAAIHHDLGDLEKLAASLDSVLENTTGTAEIRHVVGHYAAVLGEAPQAERYLVPQGGGKEQFHDHLLRGLVLLQLNRADDARREYEQAYEMAPLERDRRYALERVIASARRAGKLQELAGEWESDPKLSPDQLQALVALLSELGESQKLLELLQRPSASPEHRSLLESPEFQTQVVSAALGSGNSQQAEAAYRQLVDRYPQEMQWRISLARLWLMDNKREQATRFLMEAVEQFEGSGELMALAEAASRVSLEEVALAASNKAAQLGLPQQIRSGLFQAGLIRQRGESDEAIALVRKLVPAARKDPKLLQSVAETLERYGDKAEALRLLKELYEATGAEDTLLQVGYLLEENQKYAEAYELWSRLWSTTQVAARLKQAENRMLDLAAKTGKLADLVIDIEERLGSGKAGERELKLLIQIYTTAQDPVSAAEILQEYAAQSGSEVGLLKGLAKVYLDCEQFGRCNTTLRRLVELDPENAADYLQQIAILAMERKQPTQARKVLAELRARAVNDEMTDEFAAGVMDMTGQHEEAARAYQRVLNRHPDRIESWLLWGNAMKACGRTEAAVARFQVLVEESAEDDLFTVAVDGLLNLEAKPAALRSALRRVFGRIAIAPQKVFLYQLANDLLDALNQPGQAREVLEQSVVVGGERRSAILRELMDSAKSANDLEKQVEYGRSLVALGDELPPLVFLDLGDALLKQGQLHLAERVFDRASIDGEYSAIQQRVATSYEDVNMTADADRIIRGLLMAEPDNVPLLVRSGALNEQMGNHEQAFAQYYRATDLMLRRLPGCAQGESSRPAESERSRNRVARATNVDELTQYFESAGNGLIGTARTPALRDRLQRDLLRRIDEELSFLSANRRLMPHLSANPRLERLARFLRQVAFSLHVPDIADKVDRELLSRYPTDAELHKLVVTSRAEWGLYKRAVGLGSQAAGPPPRKAARPASRPTSRPATTPGEDVRTAGGADAPTEVNVDLVLADLKLADPLIAEKTVSAELAYRLVPALMMSGKLGEARQVLACAPPASGKELSTHCSRMMAAAIALEDMEAVQRWLGLWLERAVSLKDQQNPTAAASSIERCVRMVFRVFDHSQRFGLLERLNRVLPRLDSRNQLAVRFLQLQICDSLGAPFDGLEQLARDAAKETQLLSEDAVRLLERLDGAAQVEFLRSVVAARKPEEQRRDLLTLIGMMSQPAEPAVREAVLQMMEAAPKRKLTSGDVRFWPRNRLQSELVSAVAEKLLTETPDSPVVLVAAATARETAGRHDEAMALVREALELLLAVRQGSIEEGALIDLALEIMHPGELQAYATALAEQYEIEAPTPLQTFVLGLVLDATGRESEAIAAYRKAYAAQPANRTFSRKLILTLKQTGRTVELARTLAATLTSSTMMESFEWRSLSEAYYDLYDPIASLQAARKDETIISPVSQMRATRLMGRHQEALSIFRRSFISNRNKGFYIDLTWPLDSSPGGLIGFQPDTDEAWTSRRKMFEAMADLPWAEEEYSALLQAARPGRRDIEGLVAGLITAARLTGGWGRLVAPLEAARKAEAMTVKDQALLVELALTHPAAVSDELVKEIDGGRTHLDPADSKPLFALARVYQSRGRQPEARNILLWLMAGGIDGTIGVSTTQRLAHLDAYVATLPEAERLAVLRRWLGIMQPTALDPLTNEFGIECVDRLAAAGDERWRDQLDLLRKRADNQPADRRYLPLRIALAQRYAALGQRQVFVEQAIRVLEPAALEDVYGRSLDIRRLLPATGMAEPLAFVEVLEARLRQLYDDGDVSTDDLIRSLCLLADWCRGQQLLDKAAALVDRAQETMGEPDSSWLFVGDMRRLLGHEAGAVEIETRLLESDLLPVSRVPGLLEAVEKSRGRPAADALATRVVSYSSHPEALRRAIRHARAAGDDAAAAKLEERLQQVQPDPPLGSTRPASASAAVR